MLIELENYDVRFFVMFLMGDRYTNVSIVTILCAIIVTVGFVSISF